MKKITSLYNQEIKDLVRISSDSKERKKLGLFIIEGLRAIRTAVNSNLKLIQLYVTANNLDLAKEIANENFITILADFVMKKVSNNIAPSGVLAVFAIPMPKDEFLSPGLVLLDISDPGNMGTLIRSAAACATKSIVVIGGVDPWSPKVVQASAGTIALVNIFNWDFEKLLINKNKKKLNLYALVVSGKNIINIRDIKSTNNLLVIGNEANGIPESFQNKCDSLVTLPMPGNIESLNAAIAGSIALYITSVLNNTKK